MQKVGQFVKELRVFFAGSQSNFGIWNGVVQVSDVNTWNLLTLAFQFWNELCKPAIPSSAASCFTCFIDRYVLFKFIFIWPYSNKRKRYSFTSISNCTNRPVTSFRKPTGHHTLPVRRRGLWWARAAHTCNPEVVWRSGNRKRTPGYTPLVWSLCHSHRSRSMRRSHLSSIWAQSIFVLSQYHLPCNKWGNPLTVSKICFYNFSIKQNR